MSGLRLEDMEAVDMVDVLHFFFEEDSFRYESGEQAEAVSKGRVELYRMYGINYNYAGSGAASRTQQRKYIGKNEDFDFSNQDPFSDSPKPVKPYIPPTQFDPDTGFAAGGVLDAPLH